MSAILRRVEAMGISRNLVLSGGCALNSSFNGEVLARIGFEALYVPSAPADDGNALGAALLAWHEDSGRVPPMAGGFTSPFLGSQIATGALDRSVAMGWTPNVRRPGGDLHREVAGMLAQGKLIGWARGRAEFGPRALGNRSILADPRPPEAKDRINDRVKRREPYRPFAPAVLHEHGPDWFEDYQPAPYMERTLRFRPSMAGQVPAVVHEDGTGRLQSVRPDWCPDFHALVSEFHRLTGVPILLNTSFNIMGKPILHSAEDALAMLHTTGLDAVVVGEYLVGK
jgi:carbamoyltransferase